MKNYFNRKSVEVQRWTPLEVILNEFCLYITRRCICNGRVRGCCQIELGFAGLLWSNEEWSLPTHAARLQYRSVHKTFWFDVNMTTGRCLFHNYYNYLETTKKFTDVQMFMYIIISMNNCFRWYTPILFFVLTQHCITFVFLFCIVFS